MRKPKTNKHEKRCSICQKYQARVEFFKSKGATCNTCFAPIEENMKIKKGEKVVYTSPVNGVTEHLIAVSAPKKVNYAYYLYAKPEHIEEEVEGSKIYLRYLTRIK